MTLNTKVADLSAMTREPTAGSCSTESRTEVDEQISGFSVA